MSSDKDHLLSQFQDITGVDLERARFYLESSNWELPLAMSSFYETDGGDPVPMEESEEASAPAPAPGNNPVSRGAAGGRTGAPPPPGSSNIRNFSSLLAGQNDDSSDEEEGQAFYAGGSDTSGQQILGPPRKKNTEDFVKDMFKKAREHGAEAVDPGSSSGSRARSVAFTGGGFKLGSTPDDSEEVAGPSTSESPEPREFTLKMWQNGFSVDEGELRDYQDPANREFLASVMTGRIPLELLKEAKGGEVHVNMEDHKNEDYIKPKATAKPFGGAGHVLGSIAPPTTVDRPVMAEDDRKKCEAAAGNAIKVDPQEPTTNIQVRLNDGSRLVVRLNQTHTIADIRQYITVARPEYASQTFALMTTFPNKELTDDQASVKDAGLLGAAILLRPK